jgi:dynein heavy chain
MHENANITKDTFETNLLFSAILLTQKSGGGGGAGKSREELLIELSEETLAKMPPLYDMELAELKYPVVWSESMNTVLVQELQRFNTLNSVIIDSLVNIAKAVKGIIVLSESLEKLGNSMFFGRVPEAWLAASYPSLKPLASYVTQLLERLDFFQQWLDDKVPSVFWLSGFYFTQAFLTGTRQNFARKYKIPIDSLIFDFTMMPKEHTKYKRAPPDGIYSRGLFLEGAKWNAKKELMDDSDPKILFANTPVMWMLPVEAAKVNDFPHYKCPVYKTSERRGMLSTTGHSTNFVMFIKVPSDRPERVWIEMGVAMLTQLDD